MDPFEIGDPYIEWAEENAAKETEYLYEYNDSDKTYAVTIKEKKMANVVDNFDNIQAKLKGEVTTLLVTQHDFTMDEAEEAVNESFADKPDLWNENAEARDLANFLASEDDE